MSYNAGRVEVEVTVDKSDFDQGMDEAQQEIQSLNGSSLSGLGDSFSGIAAKAGAVGESMTQVGKSLSLSITAPLTAIGALSAKEFLEFDAALTKTQAVTGMTADEIAAMGEAAKEMAADSVFSATEVANGMYWLADGTTTAAEIQDYLAGAMDLATASGSDLGETAQVLQGLMKAYGIDASEAGRVTDILTVAFQNSLWTGAEFNTAMSYVAATASQMGIPLEQTAAALDVMSRAGYEASTAGAGLRQGLVSLVNPTSAAKEALEKYGLSADDVNPQVVGLEKALKNLHDANIDAGDAAKIFGTESMGQMMSVIQASDGDFKTLIENMENSGGAAREAAQTVEDSASGQWTQFMNELKTLAIDLGAALVPVLQDIFSAVRPLLEWFRDLSPEIKKFIVIIGMVAAAIGPVLMVLGPLLQILPLLATGIGVVNAALGFLAANPIVLVIVAIVAAIWLLYDNWDLVWSYLEPIWNAIKAVGEAIFNGLKAFFETVWNTILAVWNAVWGAIKAVVDFVWGGIKLIIETYLNIIRTIIETVLNVIKGIVEFVWNGIQQAVEFYQNLIRSVIEAVWGVIQAVISTVLGVIQGIIDAAMAAWNAIVNAAMSVLQNYIIGPFNTIRDAISAVLNGIVGFFRGAWDTIMGIVKGAVDFIMGLIRPLLDAVKGVTDAVGGIIGGAGDFIGGIGNALGLAEGGLVRARPGGVLAVLAEGGEDEWVVPDSIMQGILSVRSQVIGPAVVGGLDPAAAPKGVEDMLEIIMAPGSSSRSIAIGQLVLQAGNTTDPRKLARDLYRELQLMGVA